MRDKVHQSGRKGCESCPVVDESEGIGLARSESSLVVMRQEFGFVGGHVDVYRAVAFAAFAGETEIERFLHLFALPTVANDFALHHLEEQVGASAGAVLFFASDAIARAHRLLLVAAALAYAYAAQGRARETSAVFGKFEMRLGLPRIVVGAETQVFVETIRHSPLCPGSSSTADPRHF